MENRIKIVTHSGIFHADDIFAVATLRLVLGDDVEIVRSRDVEIIKTGDYVVDVGLVYNEDGNRFDHHQIGGAGVRENTIPYAAFGLVWKRFGLQLCNNIQEVADKIEKIMVQPVDATDNGFKLVETKIAGIYPYDIGLFFNTFNPGFEEGFDNSDKAFLEAVVIAQTVLSREIKKRLSLWGVKKVIEGIYENTEDKRLIVLDNFLPVSDFLASYPEPLFVVFPKEDGSWAIKTVQDDPNDFESRKYLPESWSGKNDKDLENITGVPGAVFCHTGRFIAVAKTKEAILKMAQIALNS